jgi:hypothetical protein
MGEGVVKAKEMLANPKSGWVNRRDAAEFLGDTAARALAALTACRNDPDVDVRSAVERMLKQVEAHLPAAKPKTGSGTHALEDLARACEKPGERIVTASGQGYDVEVKMPNGRHQRVHIAPFERKDGLKMIRILTHCGKPSGSYFAWALQTNMKLTHGALAITGEGPDQQFVILNCYAASEATPAAVKASVKEMAYYGDWLESKLTGQDVL